MQKVCTERPLSRFLSEEGQQGEIKYENGDQDSSKADKIEFRVISVNKASVSNVHLGDALIMTVLGHEQWRAVHETYIETDLPDDTTEEKWESKENGRFVCVK